MNKKSNVTYTQGPFGALRLNPGKQSQRHSMRFRAEFCGQFNVHLGLQPKSQPLNPESHKQTQFTVSSLENDGHVFVHML